MRYGSRLLTRAAPNRSHDLREWFPDQARGRIYETVCLVSRTCRTICAPGTFRGYRWRPKLRPPDGGRKLGPDPGERLGWNPELGVFDPLPKVCPALVSPRFKPPVAYFELL